MTNALETTELGRRYGRTWGLQDCTFAIPEGKVAALVGPNGAGKTTLLRMAAGLIRPTTGDIAVLGRRVPHELSEIIRDIGYLDQERPLYKHFRVDEILEFGRRMNPRWNGDAARQWISELEIPLSTTVRKLSVGHQAQVALILCMAKEPRVLLLDEPAAALDPLARQRLMQVLMGAVAERGCTVILSSHMLTDLEQVCDHLVILSKSHVQIADSVDNIMSSHRILTGPRREFDRTLKNVTVIYESNTERQSRMLVKSGGPVVDSSWHVVEPTLEEIVVGYLREPEAGLGDTNSSTPGDDRGQVSA